MAEVNSADIGAALQQAGTILNPGTYYTGPGGVVTYAPAPGALGPGLPPSTVGGMSGGTLIMLAVVAYFLFKGK